MRVGSPRSIGLAASGLVITGWLLGSTLSPPVARSEQAVRARPAPLDPLPPIEPLQQFARAAPHPAPPAPRRNPFTFDAPRAAADPDGAAAPTATADAAAMADGVADAGAAPVFPWRLVGVALDADGGVTGILSGHGDVQLVRAGDRLPDGALVLAADATGVQVRGADGVEVTLRLP